MKGFLLYGSILAVFLAVSTRMVRPVFETHESGVVVITGASSGIGKAAAIKLASLGYTVVAGVRKEADGAAILSSVENKEVAKFIVPTIIDVTKVESIEAAVVSSQKLGKVVGVVCNAGISSGGSMPVEFLDEEMEKKVIEVNYYGLKNTAVKFLPVLRENHGRLITVGSIAGTIANAFGQPYSVSKYMVKSLSDSLRHELLPLKVSVSRVEPAYVKTMILEKNGMSTPEEKRPYNMLPPEKRAVYQQGFNKIAAPLKRMASGASTTDETDDAIAHAMTAARPQAVYHPGRVGGIPAKVPGFLFKFLESIDPSWVDLLMSKLED